MNATLIATIGTRDLMFQTRSGNWYNIGDDQMRGDIIGEQAEVLADLGQDLLTYRALTQFLVKHLDEYRSRICPVITGQLLRDRAQEIDRVYLIGTNQPETVPERDKDTLYGCQIFQDWFAHQYPHIQVSIVPLGQDGTNPSDFDAMFRWWQRTWPTLVDENGTDPIWLCIKGGVGQTSEAGRISGLSRYGDRIQFFEFKQRRDKNIQGIPSDYTGPFSGTSYLWDRARQQALKLWDRYDYAGIYDILKPYFQQDTKGFSALPTQVKAGIAWNQGQFDTFLKLAKGSLPPAAQQQGTQYWWVAYEQAQLAVVRLQQQNTTEAMLSSFRAIEGLLWLWAQETFPRDVIIQPDQYPLLKQSITQRYPQLNSLFDPNSKFPDTVALQSKALRSLLEAAIPVTATSPDFKEFWDTARTKRNTYSHRLGGLTQQEVFNAWGVDMKQQAQWEQRLLNCLNMITDQSFKTLEKASLFCTIHQQVKTTISHYSPPTPTSTSPSQ
jgi:hypothetical protein